MRGGFVSCLPRTVVPPSRTIHITEGTTMTETNPTPDAVPTSTQGNEDAQDPAATPATIADLLTYQRDSEADRAERQAAAEQAAGAALADALKAAADAERDGYLKATEPTRKAPGYVERHQAYDRVRLAFIEGTAADTKAEALKLAKALPAYVKAASSDIETRAI